jgi:phosphoglycolate phosphatase-like HAD superfamily hydrolase
LGAIQTGRDKLWENQQQDSLASTAIVSNPPTLLALDFDGVICDGLIEYFQTTWRAYGQIWPDRDRVSPEEIAPLFYQLRPAIETGWEMPVLVRSLRLGMNPEKILEDWPGICSQLVADEKLDPVNIAAVVDRVRDEWIVEDLPGWLSLHRFYPGVIERVRASLAAGNHLVIITTKEERFVRSLLQQQGIHLPENSVFGKNVKRPKHQILRELLAQETPPPTIWFVEDRLKTLESVQKQLDLSAVKLYLADWGYNTPGDRTAAKYSSGIELLCLSTFCQDCTQWP